MEETRGSAICVLCLVVVAQSAFAGVSFSGDVTPDPTTTTSADNLMIGHSEAGAVTIDGGSRVDCGDAYINGPMASGGTLVVTGGGSVLMSDGVVLLRHGVMTISDGGYVYARSMFVVDDAVESTATVTGVGSVLENTSSLFAVGWTDRGELFIRDGGSVSSGGKGVIGSAADSEGTIVVEGIGSQWYHDNTVHVGKEGHGSLTIANGGSVHVGGHLWVGSTVGSVTSVGELAFVVGDDGVGTLTVDTDVKFWPGGKAILTLSAEPSVSFALGQSFDLMDWGGSFSGQFDTITLPELEPQWQWDTSRLYTDGIVTVAVPEPASVSMALLGGLVVLRRRLTHRRSGENSC